LSQQREVAPVGYGGAMEVVPTQASILLSETIAQSLEHLHKGQQPQDVELRQASFLLMMTKTALCLQPRQVVGQELSAIDDHRQP
jgi:hypothetical protein